MKHRHFAKEPVHAMSISCSHSSVSFFPLLRMLSEVKKQWVLKPLITRKNHTGCLFSCVFFLQTRLSNLFIILLHLTLYFYIWLFICLFGCAYVCVLQTDLKVILSIPNVDNFFLSVLLWSLQPSSVLRAPLCFFSPRLQQWAANLSNRCWCRRSLGATNI